MCEHDGMQSGISYAPISESERWSILDQGRREYLAAVSPSYDEVLDSVATRFTSDRCIGKVEIGGLVLWKRLQANSPWSMDLMNTSESVVREVTGRVYDAANDSSLNTPAAAKLARSEIFDLPGFRNGNALASAVLLAAAPHRLAVYDQRAHLGLARLGMHLKSGKGQYSRYMHLVEELVDLAASHGEQWTARGVDTALFWIGRPANKS